MYVVMFFLLEYKPEDGYLLKRSLKKYQKLQRNSLQSGRKYANKFDKK